VINSLDVLGSPGGCITGGEKTGNGKYALYWTISATLEPTTTTFLLLNFSGGVVFYPAFFKALNLHNIRMALMIFWWDFIPSMFAINPIPQASCS